MKIIMFYILDIEPDTNATQYHNKFNNSMITKEKGDWIFNSKYDGPTTIGYFYQKLSISPSITTMISNLLKKSIIEAKQISIENIEEEKVDGSILGSLECMLYKYSYYDNADGVDLFDLFTDVFIVILMGHYLKNGNKRVALTFLKGFLWEYGYYLKWTQGLWKDYKTHKIVIEGFVIKLENKEGNNKEETKAEIKEWIKNNVIIGLHWR